MRERDLFVQPQHWSHVGHKPRATSLENDTTNIDMDLEVCSSMLYLLRYRSARERERERDRQTECWQVHPSISWLSFLTNTFIRYTCEQLRLKFALLRNFFQLSLRQLAAFYKQHVLPTARCVWSFFIRATRTSGA